MINFSMDILVLCLSGKILHKKRSKLRLCGAAVLGGTVATLITVLFNGNDTATRIAVIVLGIITSMIMVVIGFGKPNDIISLIRESVIVWGVGALMGGIMTVIMTIGSPVVSEGQTSSYLSVFSLCIAVSTVTVRLFSSSSARKTGVVSIFVNGEEFSFCGICDSGSFATEPISGRPVIIVKAFAVERIARELERDDCGYRIRFIPVEGLTGSALLKGFVPDRVCVDGIDVDAVIAIDRGSGRFSGQEGIIPAAFCKHK